MQQPNMYPKGNQNSTVGGPPPQMNQGGPPMQQPPPQQQQQQQQQQSQQGKSLWIGDVLPWMNEKDIAKQFDKIAQVTNVKLIKDKLTNKPVGYGFVEFQDFETARDVFTTLNGKKIPGQENRYFKLNWASHGGGVARAYNQGPMGFNQGGSNMGGGGGYQNNMRQNYPSNHNGPPNHYMGQPGGGSSYGGGQSHNPHQEAYQVYVGDLDPVVTNHNLLQFFKQIYNSVCEAKVIVDPVSRKSKGYGFIKFQSKDESERALQEMNGKQLYGRPIKMNYASQRTPQNNQNMNNRFGQMPSHPNQPPMQGGQMHHHQNHYGHQQNQFMQGPGGPLNSNAQTSESTMMGMPQPSFNKVNSSGYSDPFMDNIYPNLNQGYGGPGQRQPPYNQPGMIPPHPGMPAGQMMNDKLMMAPGYGQGGMQNFQQSQHSQYPPTDSIQNPQNNPLPGGQNMSQNYGMPQGLNSFNKQYPQQNNMNQGQVPNHLLNAQGNMRPLDGRGPPNRQEPSQQYNNNAEFNSQQFKNNQSNMGNNGLSNQKQLSQHGLDNNQHNGQDVQGYNRLDHPQMNQKGGIQNGNGDLAGSFNNPMNNSQKIIEQQANLLNSAGDLNNFNHPQNMPNSYNLQKSPSQHVHQDQAYPPNQQNSNAELPADHNALHKVNYAAPGNPNDNLQHQNYQMPPQAQNPEAKSQAALNDNTQSRMPHNPENQGGKGPEQSAMQKPPADLAHGYDPLSSVNAKSAPPSSLAPQQDAAGHPGQPPSSSYPMKGETSQLQDYGRMQSYMNGTSQSDHQAQTQQPHQFYYQQNPHGYGGYGESQHPVMPYDHMAPHGVQPPNANEGVAMATGMGLGGGVNKSKPAIDPISPEEIARMNREYLEPLIDNSEVLYIL